ncbi:GerMN domain-containing protein [Actinacidiphila acidipaludis]|uniref:GerMN domain-containing protein n=1 Tax=Actinacidiphila acidipaludis TaxID=2873382 RepID=A0ABS7Q6W7_9ACTN|nr:GerMN domain-containing protein [Streptomyces acidipaludis]MBY8877529.1 GerMN domain-containing protein [Streptomyces acidipaludis]
MPTTGVVDVGMPASGLPAVPVAADRVVVYFLDGDRLQAAQEKIAGDADPVAAAVHLLFAGPGAAGRPDLTTRLPHLTSPVQVRLQDGTVTLTLPAGTAAPDSAGVRQLVCTAATAYRLSGGAPHLAQPRVGGSIPGTAVPAPTPSEAASASVTVRVALHGSPWHHTQSDPACPR